LVVGENVAARRCTIPLIKIIKTYIVSANIINNKNQEERILKI